MNQDGWYAIKQRNQAKTNLDLLLYSKKELQEKLIRSPDL